MRTVVLFLAVLPFSTAVHAATLRVPADHPTIQQAIDASCDGDTVLVGPGTYVENIDFKGMGITIKSQNGPDGTIIDGNQSGRVVTFKEGEGSDSILRGFTITNGSWWRKDDGVFVDGGGIYCCAAAPTIRNNIIVGNSAGIGGGILSDNRKFDESQPGPNISNNIISDNTASYGGGIGCLVKSSPIISNNTICSNTGLYSGGGINCLRSSNPSITCNIISGNSSPRGGGICCVKACFPTISNNIIFDNSADNGAGIECYNKCSVTISNNTIYGNAASFAGGGIRCYLCSEAVVSNTIVWNNKARKGPEILVRLFSSLTISHSDVKSGVSSIFVDSNSTLDWGDGMIQDSPQFVDSANRDLHLLYTSPCRNTGDHGAAGYQESDFEGDPRQVDGVIDMGADEFHPHLYFTGDTAPEGRGEIKVIGTPGEGPVILCIGTGLPHYQTSDKHGYPWLSFPLKILAWMDSSLSLNGVHTLPLTIPPEIPSPWILSMQAICENQRTNSCKLKSR